MEILEYFKALEKHNFFYYREYAQEDYIRWRDNEVKLILISFDSDQHTRLFDFWADYRIMGTIKPVIDDYLI